MQTHTHEDFKDLKVGNMLFSAIVHLLIIHKLNCEIQVLSLASISEINIKDWSVITDRCLKF